MALRKQCQGASPQGTNAVCPSGRLRGFVRSCKNLFPRSVNVPGRADVGIGPYDVMPCLLRRDDHWSSGTFRHAHTRLYLQTATFRTANGRPYLIGRSDGRSHMTVFSGPTGPKILLTQNQVIMPYRVPQNDSLHDRSANADRSHMPDTGYPPKTKTPCLATGGNFVWDQT